VPVGDGAWEVGDCPAQFFGLAIPASVTPPLTQSCTTANHTTAAALMVWHVTQRLCAWGSHSLDDVCQCGMVRVSV